VLAPVAGRLEGVLFGLQILRLLAPDINRLHLLQVIERKRSILSQLPSSKGKSLRKEALSQLRGIKTQIKEELELPAGAIELLVRIADDWTRETILQANYLHSELVFVEASRPGLAQRFLPGGPVETLLANANCDVAVFRGVG
jgi:nucleotide-binding universal stress UspA family protein